MFLMKYISAIFSLLPYLFKAYHFPLDNWQWYSYRSLKQKESLWYMTVCCLLCHDHVLLHHICSTLPPTLFSLLMFSSRFYVLHLQPGREEAHNLFHLFCTPMFLFHHLQSTKDAALHRRSFTHQAWYHLHWSPIAIWDFKHRSFLGLPGACKDWMIPCLLPMNNCHSSWFSMSLLEEHYYFIPTILRVSGQEDMECHSTLDWVSCHILFSQEDMQHDKNPDMQGIDFLNSVPTKAT